MHRYRWQARHSGCQRADQANCQCAAVRHDVGDWHGGILVVQLHRAAGLHVAIAELQTLGTEGGWDSLLELGLHALKEGGHRIIGGSLHNDGHAATAPDPVAQAALRRRPGHRRRGSALRGRFPGLARQGRFLGLARRGRFLGLVCGPFWQRLQWRPRLHAELVKPCRQGRERPIQCCRRPVAARAPQRRRHTRWRPEDRRGLIRVRASERQRRRRGPGRSDTAEEVAGGTVVHWIIGVEPRGMFGVLGRVRRAPGAGGARPYKFGL
mmetsp:Transcript_66710/g.184720  ORF Transcript_66710/g.184720 Transcript_66710/m.184720 type:complete len:267 (+) Transcript_66710:928-1728(+)